MSYKGNHGALFTPWTIAGNTIKNRFVMMPMGIGGQFLVSPAVENRKAGYDYFIERARGGVGLIITGANTVLNTRSNLWMQQYADKFYSPKWMHEFPEEFEAMKYVTEGVHQYGAKILFQIGAGYGRTLKATKDVIRACGGDPNVFFVAPSDNVPNVWTPSEMHRGLTTEEVWEYIDCFAKSAKLAQSAGFDGIEIHALHEGYLLDSFTMDNINNRTDEFGGSFENRMRFPCEVIKAVKKSCGKNFIVSMRFSACSKTRGYNDGVLPGEPYVEFGRSLEESPVQAQMLEAAGLDVLNVDNGTYDSWYWCHPPMYMPKGCNLPEAAYLKHFLSIPVICGGRMDDPDMSARAISMEQIDGIGIGRTLLADPQYVNKLQAGQLEDIRPCIACHNGCLAEINAGRHMSCAVNPTVFQEKELALKPAKIKKKVAVIGGGVGGMETARLCAERGHDVMLFEQDNILGGTFIAAAAMDFKENDRMLLDWYRHMVDKNNVKVRLNTVATPEALKDDGYDTVVVANGAKPKSVPIKGFENAIEVTKFLCGKAEVGNKVAIIGGGLSGIEVAYQLVLDGKHPIVVEIQSDILSEKGLSPANRMMLVDLLKYHKVPVYTNTIVKELGSDYMVVTDGNNVEHRIDIDSSLAAVGYNPVATTYEEFRSAFNEVYVVGDARSPGNLLSVVRDAYSVAYAI